MQSLRDNYPAQSLRDNYPAQSLRDNYIVIEKPAKPTVAQIAAVAKLLGRTPEGDFRVKVIRASPVQASPVQASPVQANTVQAEPVVIENAPFTAGGRPMPTRYWLVDAELCLEVSRLEGGGAVRQAEQAVGEAALAELHSRYAKSRDALIKPGHSGPVPSGGVGGTRRGVKCLHAHLAHYLATGADEVGDWTAQQLAKQKLTKQKLTKQQPANRPSQ